jgi:hypothetical protein
MNRMSAIKIGRGALTSIARTWPGRPPPGRTGECRDRSRLRWITEAELIVQKSRLALHEDESRIVAKIRSESGNLAPSELLMGVPGAHPGWLDMNGNPFVPPLLPVAATLG